MSPFYSAFGLGLCTDRPVPGLVPLPSLAQPDTRIWLDTVPSLPIRELAQKLWYFSPDTCEEGTPALQVWRLPARGESCSRGSSDPRNGANLKIRGYVRNFHHGLLADTTYFRLLYSDGTEFLVDRTGSEVWARWPDSSTLEDTATYLLGPILGFVLRLRGVTCLHASAVAVGDRAIALVGPASAGKSTTAAAFARMGHPVLTDDIVALWESADALYVQPAYPQLRLWPDSVALLYGTADALPRLTPTWDKRGLDLTRNGCRFQQQPLPLAAVYVLTERGSADAAPRVEGLRGRENLLTLVANTYVGYLLDRAMRAQEFASLARIVTSVPVRRVAPPADPAHVTQLCTRILEDFQALH